MKMIEEFVKTVQFDAAHNGTWNNSNKYNMQLDKDGYIKAIQFDSLPSSEYLERCSEKEKILLLRALEFKTKAMEEWKNFYNECNREYNDYCGKRAGESDALLKLVVDGYNIGNVLPFSLEKRTKKSATKGKSTSL